MSGQAHRPAGSPASTGGQFTEATHDESGISLAAQAAATRPELAETDRGVYPVVEAGTERISDTMVKVHRGGVPHTQAETKMAALRLTRSTGQDITDAKVRHLADGRKKATVLLQGANGDITVKEGTLAEHPSEPGSVMMFNKGSGVNGIWISRPAGAVSSTVVAVAAGYGHAEALAAEFHDAADRSPRLEPVTVDDLPVDRGGSQRPIDIAAVYVISHPGFGDGEAPGTVFLATDQQPGDGPDGTAIINGYQVAGDSQMTSERGSIYEHDLRRLGGRVTGYRPGSITYRQAMDLGESADWENDIEATWDAVAAACESAP